MKTILGILIILFSLFAATALGYYMVALSLWEIIKAVQNDAITLGSLAWAAFWLSVRSIATFVVALIGMLAGWSIISLDN
jgi:hypothetical protein